MEHIKSDLGVKVQSKFGRIWVSMEQFKRCWWPMIRQTPVGFFVGVLPGAGATIAALMAYNNEKQLSKNPENFGKGEIVGLAAPEASNNACSVGALIPMMTLGVPGSGTTAVMLGALMILGLQPGPLLFQQHADIAWTVIASMFIGNIICAFINIPLASLLVRVLAVPTKILYPVIVAMALIGVYTINFSTLDFVLLVIFGLIGYFMKKYKVPTSPLILAVVVGVSMEQSFRQSMMLSGGDISILFRSAICWVLFFLTIFSVVWPFVSDWNKKKKAKAA